MSGEGSQGNREVPRQNWPLEEGGTWGKPGFPHGSELKASDNQAPRWENHAPCSSSRKTTTFSPALEHDLEVAPVDRLLGPPAVDDAPFLADDRDRLAVHPPRRPVEACVDEGGRGSLSLEAAVSLAGTYRSVARNEQRPWLRDPRPRRDLDDGGDRSARRHAREPGAGRPGDGPRALRLRGGRARAGGPRTRSASAARGRGERGRGELCELRPERRPQRPPLRRRLAERHGATPRAAADESRRERDLADRPPAALGAGEDPVEQCRQCAAEGQLVADRLGELEPLGELGRRRRAVLRASKPASSAARRSRQAPGAPAVRPQTFGDGAARQPGKLSDLLDSEALELLAALCFERKQRERQRREELLGALVVDDERLARPGDRCRGERGEAAVGSAGTGVPGGADRGERALQRRRRRRRRAARPRAYRSRGSRARPARPRSRRPRAGARSPPTPAPPRPGPARRARATGRWRAPRPAACPAGRRPPRRQR